MTIATQWIFRSLVIASFSTYLALASATDINAQSVKQVDFAQESTSQNARNIANLVIDSGDNRNMPFMIIDKMNAKVFVFNPDGRRRGSRAAWYVTRR